MDILKIAKEAGSLALKYQHQDLYEHIIALRETLLELREENLGLREELKTAKEFKNISENLSRFGDSYILNGNAGNQYCLTCWDSNRKLITLQGADLYCGVCKATHS